MQYYKVILILVAITSSSNASNLDTPHRLNKFDHHEGWTAGMSLGITIPNYEGHEKVSGLGTNANLGHFLSKRWTLVANFDVNMWREHLPTNLRATKSSVQAIASASVKFYATESVWLKASAGQAWFRNVTEDTQTSIVPAYSLGFGFEWLDEADFSLNVAAAATTTVNKDNTLAILVGFQKKNLQR